MVITDAGANTIGMANGGNVISGNGQNGIAIFGVASIGNQIYANRIGANFQATGPIGNQQDGIRIDSAVTTVIGGADESLRNVIGGNVQHGIGLYDGASGTRIVGNTIGFSAPLTFLGNALEGIQVNNASNTTIGGSAAEQANLISRNGRNGVSVIAGTHNLIEGNRIFGNTALGIDLGNDGVTANDTGDGDTGPNNLQNFPVLDRCCGWRHRHAEQHAWLRIPDRVLRQRRLRRVAARGRGDVPRQRAGAHGRKRQRDDPAVPGGGRTDGDGNRHERQRRRRHLRILGVRDRAGGAADRRT